MINSYVKPKKKTAVIDFNDDEVELIEQSENLVDVIQASIICQGLIFDSLAENMGMKPSMLAMKLSGNYKHRVFTVDDLENYLSVTGDSMPLKYFAWKYLRRESKTETQKFIEGSK